MADESSANLLQLAQIERTQLENEKLKIEVAALKRSPWYQFPIRLVPLVTALIAVGGFLIGVLKYTDEQSKARADREMQSLREHAIAEQEFMKPWLESQRTVYAEALSAAAAAANTSDAKLRLVAAQSFWQLYQGRMILVETTTVSGAMKHFGRCLDGTDVCNKEEMNRRSRALGTAMAESMAATARMSYEEFARNQFKYTAGP